MELNPLSCRKAATALLEVTTNPVHRQILENYRLHTTLEVAGYWPHIFDTSMIGR